MKYIANGKINLDLQIKFKRKDGYHDLMTHMSEITFGDEIEISEANKDTLVCNEFSIRRDNLMIKALERFRRDFFAPPQEIILKKKLPIGGGLGGGSSDAAVMLKHLASTYKPDISKEEMFDIAKDIGMDVSFFLFNSPSKAALCYGRGELVEPVDSEECQVLIVFNHASLSKDVYKFVKPKIGRYSRYTNDLKEPAFLANKKLKQFYEYLLSFDKDFRLSGAGGSFYLIGEKDELKLIKDKIDAKFSVITNVYLPISYLKG